MNQEQMTLRIRLYLFGAAAHHAALGLALIFTANLFNPDVYADLFLTAPRWVWITTMLFGAVHFTFAGITHSETHARIALIMGAGVGAMWAVAFAFVVGDGIPALTATILFAVLAFKDLVICAGPLCSPLAPVIRAYGP